MTWNLSYTVPYSSQADLHAAMVYLFDSALPALSTWTTGPTAAGLAYQRKGRRTSTNLLGGGSYNEYFWFSWGSATVPTTLTAYEDSTYTTTPGDLNTNTDNSTSSVMTTGLSGSIKFWTSSVNPNALLVTRNKSVLFWEPGWTGACFHEDSAWTGAASSRRTQIFPAMRSAYMEGTGRPQTATTTSTVEFSICALLGFIATTNAIETRIDLNCPMGWSGNNSSNTINTGAGLAYVGMGNDVGFYRPAVSSNSGRFWQSASVTGSLWLINGRYYLAPSDQNSAYAQMVFDMGDTEPNLT